MNMKTVKENTMPPFNAQKWWDRWFLALAMVLIALAIGSLELALR